MGLFNSLTKLEVSIALTEGIKNKSGKSSMRFKNNPLMEMDNFYYYKNQFLIF